MLCVHHIRPETSQRQQDPQQQLTVRGIAQRDVFWAIVLAQSRFIWYLCHQAEGKQFPNKHPKTREKNQTKLLITKQASVVAVVQVCWQQCAGRGQGQHTSGGG